MPSAPTLEAFQYADHLVEAHAETSWKLIMCWMWLEFWTNYRVSICVKISEIFRGIFTMNRKSNFKSDQFGVVHMDPDWIPRYRRYPRSEVAKWMSFLPLDY